MIEIEVKVRADHSKARPILDKIGAIKIGVESQSDIYFAVPYRDFAKTDEALRIRSLDGKAVLTYKGPKLDSVSKTRKEFETPVDEAATIEILHALGFFSAGEITVCLDAVEELGEFLEVEIMAESENEFEASRAKLFKLLNQFGAGEEDSIRTSYLEMVLEKSKS